MTDLRAAAQEALEALESSRIFVTTREKTKHPEGTEWYDSAITALREALEQPEQEPSQWRDMVVVNLVREGINKHRARELADHFAAQPEQEPWREFASDYERGVICGRQMQAQSSVNKAVNAMTQRKWVGLTPEEVQFFALKHRQLVNAHYDAASDTNIITAAFEATVFYKTVEQALKERNG